MKILTTQCSSRTVSEITELGKVLIIGGRDGVTWNSEKVDLVDLNTGELCPFYPSPDGYWVNYGEGIYTNGKAFACDHKDECVSCNGNTWLENDPPNFPIELYGQAAAILESGQWIAIDTYHHDPLATTIYDPDTNSFLQGPYIELPFSYGFCIVEIEPNKLGFLMNNAEMYHFQLPNGPLEKIKDTGIYYTHGGSCNVVIHDGIKTGIINLHHS
jgi:hypothetical protein